MGAPGLVPGVTDSDCNSGGYSSFSGSAPTWGRWPLMTGFRTVPRRVPPRNKNRRSVDKTDGTIFRDTYGRY